MRRLVLNSNGEQLVDSIRGLSNAIAWQYGFPLALANGLISLGLVIDALPVRFFLLAFGGTFATVVLIAFAWKLYLERKLFHVQIAILEKALPPKPEKPFSFNPIPTLDNPNRALHVDAEAVPSREFLEWLAGQTGIPSEVETEAQWGEIADAWYNTLAGLGFIKGRGAHGAAGVLTAPLPRMLEHFHYV